MRGMGSAGGTKLTESKATAAHRTVNAPRRSSHVRRRILRQNAEQIWRPTISAMQQAEMNDLIQQLEQASAGSRELDKAIARARGFRIAASTSGPIIMRQNDDVASWDLPHYTTNLQDARSLIPADYNLVLCGVNSSWSAVLNPTWDHSPNRPPFYSSGTNADPCVSIVIAALKAIEA